MVDRTYTHPEVFEAAAAGAAWADPETDPTRIDWAARQAACPLAFAPGFRLVDGRPVSPGVPTSVRHGRYRLGHWGPQLCADTLITAKDQYGHRWILLIERRGDDGTSGWALPGGYVEAGEDPVDAALREVGEETGFRLNRARVSYVAMPPRYVPDTRESDESWMVTVPVRVDLGDGFEVFPVVVGRDDAKRAAWVPADTYDVLTSHLADVHGGHVFAAHRPMLAEALAGGRR